MDFVRAYAAQPTSTKVFFVQYVSLMLIVLTVLAGVLSTPPPPAAPIPSTVIQEAPAFSPWSVWDLPVADGWRGEIATRVVLLNAHDINLELEIRAGTLSEALGLYTRLRADADPMLVEPRSMRISVLLDPRALAVQVRERWRKPFSGEAKSKHAQSFREVIE